MEDADARVRADIERFGWHAALIPPEGPVPGWVLSIGLGERFGHPELIAFGADLRLLHALVNRAGADVRAGSRYEAGREYSGLLENLRCAFRRVDPRWREVFLGNAGWYYRGRSWDAIQCFWPDASGRFPWDPRFDPEWRGDQPLLFEAEVDAALSPALAQTLRREGAL